ncbi:vang-like protein 1 [Platysternon megacephalum]|uniref:Vang-like protein 1 n=1 Tax=Platysternon megacephalum TaxID=55544 RepID=A0A4D9EBV6_9SAUR|nr:vang-like protein 1 [Platysternon megacephalum]
MVRRRTPAQRDRGATPQLGQPAGCRNPEEEPPNTAEVQHLHRRALLSGPSPGLRHRVCAAPDTQYTAVVAIGAQGFGSPARLGLNGALARHQSLAELWRGEPLPRNGSVLGQSITCRRNRLDHRPSHTPGGSGPGTGCTVPRLVINTGQGCHSGKPKGCPCSALGPNSCCLAGTVRLGWAGSGSVAPRCRHRQGAANHPGSQCPLRRTGASEAGGVLRAGRRSLAPVLSPARLHAAQTGAHRDPSRPAAPHGGRTFWGGWDKSRPSLAPGAGGVSGCGASVGNTPPPGAPGAAWTLAPYIASCP